ncbi:MAG: hypothetical protein LAT68_16680, partial [Cyclobacteriaceae bacterium]|nr:hypothetical protein [Cyclobacteriaceae bacterium]
MNEPSFPLQLSRRLRFAVFLLIPLAVLRSARPVISFIHTHWLFSYAHGFMKRGFVGEVLRQLEVAPTYGVVQGLSMI